MNDITQKTKIGIPLVIALTSCVVLITGKAFITLNELDKKYLPAVYAVEMEERMKEEREGLERRIDALASITLTEDKYKLYKAMANITNK